MGKIDGRRHEITEADVLNEPIKAHLASASGPGGSKRLEVAVNLKTHAVAYIVNDTIYSWLGDAITAYNEAPGP